MRSKESVNLISALILALVIQGCSSSLTSKEMAEFASLSGSCESFETYFHDTVQNSYENFEEIPKPQDVIVDFKETVKEELSEEDGRILSESLNSLYGLIYSEYEKFSDKDEALRDIIKLEYKTHENENLQKEYDKSLLIFMTLSQKHLPSCTKPDETLNEEQPSVPTPALPFYEELLSKTNLMQFGAIKTFSVAYQSCTAHSKAPIHSESESLEGVTRVGTHPAGGGVRVITNKEKVLKTHPYILNNRVPSSESCADPTQKPKIYDFGGKPYSTTAINSTLNFFKDAGTGSKEFGVDCSGYVYSALMSAGLKISESKPLRARGVLETPARAFKNFEASGMNCFSKVKTGDKVEPIMPGDIFASTGHIFIVNIVGEDPLGVEELLKNNSSCEQVSYKNFNFSLFQSSPTNGAIGLNHMQASYYLGDSTTMRIGLEKFAKSHCEGLKNKTQKEQNVTEGTLIRHKMTPQCIQGEPLVLDNESCLERCS